MKRKFLYTIVLMLTSVSSNLAIFSSVNADGEVATSMFVSPMSSKLGELKPGEVYEGIVEVSNAANAIYNLGYKATVGSYSLQRSDENGKDSYGSIDTTKQSNHNMMMDWITLENASGEVEPNGTAKVKYKINVPENAPAGSQYSTILITDATKLPENTNEESKNNITIENELQIMVPLLANISGDTKEKGIISDNFIPSFLTTGPLGTTSMVRNEGNIYTDAEYTLQVWPLFSDEEICTNEENPETSLVLPDTERYHSQSCALPPVGIFRAKQTVKIFGEKSIVEKTIIVCPIWLLFIIIFAIFALIFYFVARAKSRKKAAKSPQAK